MNLIKKLWRFSIVLSFAIVITTAAHAQFSGNVQGTVSDQTGAVVPNAAVTLHNVDTGIDAQSMTNSRGFYRFSTVAPGNYTVNVTSTGFSTASIAFPVTTAETRGVDVTLQVSKGVTGITVKSIAPALNPDETRIQTTISSAEIGKLPLPNRDVQLLIALTPGVVGFQNENPSSGYGNSIFAGNFAPPYSANGLGSYSNLYLIDDLPVNSSQNQGDAMMLPNADMIDQVALQTQTYSVENGAAASIQTSFTTKSGTNGFHGSADDTYASSNIGEAKDPFTDLINPFHQNLMLASLGGPMWKDHSFFFGSVEKQNAGIGGTEINTNPVITPQFAAWALNAFPNSGTAKGLVLAPPTRDVGGTVRTASSYTGLAALCGTPQTVNGLPYNLPCDMPVYITSPIFEQSQPFDGLQWNVRLDQNFRDGKDKLYGMYERIDQTLGNLSDRPALDGNSPSQNKYFSVNYVHIFSRKFLNEAHFGNLRSINSLGLKDPAIAGSFPDSGEFNDTAAGQFTIPFDTPYGAQINKEHDYAFRDTVTYAAGNHTIRAGYQYQRGDVFQDSSSIYSRPFYPFYSTDTLSWVSNTATTSYNLYTISGNGNYAPQLYGASSTFNSAFVEDNWKAGDRLTLTAGIRYDNFGNPVSYGSTAQPFTPMFLGSGSTFQQQALNTTTRVADHAFTSSQNLNFMPRAGFAYTPTENRTTLIHGGIGVYENAPTPFQIASNLPTNPPTRLSLYPTGILPWGTFNATAAPYGRNYTGVYPTYGSAPWGNAYSNAAQTAVYSSNLNGFVPNLKPEKALNYSLGIEQQFAANIVFGISYVGSHGYDLLYGSAASGQGGNVDYNLATAPPGVTPVRPTDHWGQINYGRNGLSSSFNQMVVTLKQNYKSLSYQANYNWSRDLQDAPTVVSSATGDTYNIWNSVLDPKQYYGPSAHDVPNSFSFAGAYVVPKLFQNRLANQAASGWRISAIVIAQSGTPFSVVDTTTDYAHNGSYTLDGTGVALGLPTYLGTQRRGFSRSQAKAGAFTVAQFVDPAGTGNQEVESTQGANTFRNLGYFTANAGLSKGFNVRLPYLGIGHFILRGEAVNLLNRTNYTSFGDDVTDTNTFGKVTSDDQRRYLQLGGRFEF